MPRWLLASGLSWLTATAGAGEPTGTQAGETRGSDAAAIAVELNRAEPVGNGCRLSFVIRNRTPLVLTSLQWDLVFFDGDGLIAGRTAAEAAPLPADKTSVKVFDVPGLPCTRLKRVLINDVLRCTGEPGDDTPIDCLGLTVPSNRTDIELMK